MFQDLAQAIDQGEQSYFLGTIVTIPRSPDNLEVIDGQQRLATTAILLAQMRRYLANRETLIAESINEFLEVIDREKRARVLRLHLNLDDNEFFRRAISDSLDDLHVKRDSHKRISDALREAEHHVNRIVGPHDYLRHGDVLNRWLNFIEHGAQVILLTVPSDVNAYKMFETLNDRGLKTSQSDLVKNYLFGQSGDRLSEAQQKWTFIRGALETLDETDITVTFLRHALITIRGHLRESAVYEAVQSAARGEQNTITFLEKLETLASAYVAIFNPEHEHWNSYPDSIRDAIKTLNLFNIRPFRPLMLAIAAHFSQKEAAKSFAAFVVWGVRLLLASSTRSGSVETPIAEASKLVADGKIKTTARLKKKLSHVIPSDQRFKQAVEVATVSKASLARYYLRTLERTANCEKTPYFVPLEDKETINLEHVLPLKPSQNWYLVFNEETVQVYVRRIGNMALLSATKNLNMGSKDFETKRAVYATSPYKLTNEIAKVDQWNETEISNRQKRLAVLALDAWPL